MNLIEFLEALNQGADKAFDENAKSMIDSLLHTDLPSKLKRSVNMARLNTKTHEEIVAHTKKKLEFHALGESDDLLSATMASTPSTTKMLLSNGTDANKDIQCTNCKSKDHPGKNCPQLKKMRQIDAKIGKKPQLPTYPECPTCSKTNNAAEKL